MELKRTDEQRLAHLMRSAQTGDARAYDELLRAITPLVRGIVRQQRRFLDAADVEDLVQDILLSLHAARETYDPDQPLLPWLRGIVRHRLADSGRRYGRSAAHEVLVDSLPDAADEATDIGGEEYRDPAMLKLAIGALSRVQRMAIETLKIQEMSLTEAAENTGMTTGALRVAAHRGMISLRKKLMEHDDGDSTPVGTRSQLASLH